MNKLKTIIARWVCREYMNHPDGFKSKYFETQGKWVKGLTLRSLWRARN